MQWLAPYLTYSWMLDGGHEPVESLLGALCSLVAVYPCMLAFGLAIKWLDIGRYRAGRYPLWGVYYFRWWFVNSLLSSIPIDYLGGTPLLGLYYRLMGARIGRNVHLGDGVSDEDLWYVSRGTRVFAGEVWRGSPARKVGNAEPAAASRPAWGTRFGWGLAHAVGVVLVPLYVVGAVFPGMMVMSHMNEADDYYYYLVVTPMDAQSYEVILALEI